MRRARSTQRLALCWLLFAALPAAAAEKASVAVLPLVSSAPVFIAQSRGFFAAEGLEVELRFFQAAQPVALAVASGDLDIGVTGLTAGFYNLAGRGALDLIAGQSRVEPGDGFIAYVVSTKAWNAGLRSLDALPGRSVGITQTGSTFHYMVGRLAEVRQRLEPDGMVFVEGALWRAISEDGPVDVGDWVRVTAVHELRLVVRRLDTEEVKLS